ncbi:MAG: exodeoxyribonuclease VII small subunit [Lentisphaeria bacterium]|jgi:exodeoxyribonuclease VII small subunit
MTEPAANPKPPASFEEALARLEAIVAEMESGSLKLDECMARHAEGAKLAAFCEKKLAEAERKIEILAGRDAAGEPRWEECPAPSPKPEADDQP